MSWTLPAGAVLGILGRKPDPGLTKPRLAAAHGDRYAAAAYEAMLFDFLDAWGSERWIGPGGRRVLLYEPAGAGEWLDARTPASFALQPQVEGDLGRRLHAFFDGEFSEGASRVVLLASDTPTLDPSIVVSAFLCLEGRDVVLGPATDGGLYLIGARDRLPALFEDLPWGTPTVLVKAALRLRREGLTVAVLPPWFDVDTPQDWVVLVGHVEAMRAAGLDPGLPRLERLIEEGWHP